MLTPIDIQNHSLKTAVRGYSKKETDDFLDEILKGYEELYKENRELKDKITSLSEGIQYYKQMETTLQKALVLAEKTSAETQEAAKSKAEAMTNEAQAKAEAVTGEARSKAEAMVSEAQTKAEAILKESQTEAEALRKEVQAYSDITKSKANRELEDTRNHVRKLVQSYENYRLQFKKLAESQIEMLESEHYSIFAPELSEMLDDAPDADAVMDAERTVPINAVKSDRKNSPAANQEAVAEEVVEWTDSLPVLEEESIEETAASLSESVDALDSERASEEEEKPSEDRISEDDMQESHTGKAEEAETEQKQGVMEENDTIAGDSFNASEDTIEKKEEEASKERKMSPEEEERASIMAKIKIPDMEITADTIVPGIKPPKKDDGEEKAQKETAAAEENVTPKLKDYDQIAVSKTVEPSHENSPFTFIDTE